MAEPLSVTSHVVTERKRPTFEPPAAPIARPYMTPEPRVENAEFARAALQGAVYALAKLPEGWDGYQGKPSSRNAILDGIAFIHHMPEDWPDPMISVGGSGVFSFYWKENGAVVDIEFDGTGAISAYVAENGQIRLSEIIPIVGARIAEKLSDLVRPLLRQV